MRSKDHVSEGWYQEYCGDPLDDDMAGYEGLRELHEQQIDIAAAATEGGPLSRESPWRCKDGAVVFVKDMTDGHLLNTIRVLQGKSPHGTTYRTTEECRKEWTQVMCNEAYRRGLSVEGYV